MKISQDIAIFKVFTGQPGTGNMIASFDFSLSSAIGPVELLTQIVRFMGPTWGPPGSCRPQMGPMLAPWTLLSGKLCFVFTSSIIVNPPQVTGPLMPAAAVILSAQLSRPAGQRPHQRSWPPLGQQRSPYCAWQRPRSKTRVSGHVISRQRHAGKWRACRYFGLLIWQWHCHGAVWITVRLPYQRCDLFRYNGTIWQLYVHTDVRLM